MSDNRAVRYTEINDETGEEVVIYRASGLSMCDKIFVALDQGYTPKEMPEWFREVLDEGTRMEKDIIDMFEGTYEQAVTDMSQHEINWEVIPGVIIRGHIDGMTVDGDLVEAKKFRPSTWTTFPRKKIEAQPYYPFQSSIYCHALRDEFDTDVGIWFVGGEYMSKEDDRGDNVEEWIESVQAFHYPDPPINKLAIMKRVKYLENLIEEGTDESEVACPANKMFPCPFFYLHDDGEIEATERPADDTVIDLVKMHEEARAKASEHRKLADEYTKQAKDLKGGVQGWLEASGVPTDTETTVVIDGKEWTLKYATVERAGYTVEPTEYQSVTIAAPKQAKALAASKATKPKVKKAAAKKTAAKKTAAKKIAARK